MSMPALSVWKTDLPAALPPVANTSWKAALALYIDDHVSDFLNFKTIKKSNGDPGGAYTWNLSTFQAGLSGGDATTLANAFQAAVTASVMAVATGSYTGTKSDASTFSAVASVVVDPASVTLARNKILELASIPSVADATESQFPQKIREAFALLTFTVTGTNSVASTPAPLVVTAGAVE